MDMVKSVAIFFLGLSSPVLVHVFHVTWGLVAPPEGGDVMSGILASFPANLVAGAVFIVSLIVIWRIVAKERMEKRKEQERREVDRGKYYELMSEVRDELRKLRDGGTTKTK